jgi:hypothetical protein
MPNLYRVGVEHTQTVIRSHDPCFMENLADVLEGKPVHSTVHDELRTFAGNLRDVLKGNIAAHAKEL